MIEIFNKFKTSSFYKPTILIIILIVLTIIMDKIVMPFYIKLGEEIELLDVIDMNLEEAENTLKNNGFSVVVKDSLYDANHEVGTVIEQNPYPYAIVKKGRRVYLTISIGEKPIIMPNLFGVSPREAELILESNGLKLIAKNYGYHHIYSEGTVMQQSYPPGQELKPGSKIDIIISLGEFKEEKEVPELIGRSFHEAKELLKTIDLMLGEISFEEKSNILPETVIGQSLPSGTIFKSGDLIDLIVSREKIEKE
jgi:beta-lactam-binding protein with PASTA domain